MQARVFGRCRVTEEESNKKSQNTPYSQTVNTQNLHVHVQHASAIQIVSVNFGIHEHIHSTSTQVHVHYALYSLPFLYHVMQLMVV